MGRVIPGNVLESSEGERSDQITDCFVVVHIFDFWSFALSSVPITERLYYIY